jgi:hypothetical protein
MAHNLTVTEILVTRTATGERDRTMTVMPFAATTPQDLYPADPLLTAMDQSKRLAFNEKGSCPHGSKCCYRHTCVKCDSSSHGGFKCHK